MTLVVRSKLLPSEPLPAEDRSAWLESAAAEVLGMIPGGSVAHFRQSQRGGGDVMVALNLAGAVCGVFGVRCSGQLALTLAGRAFGVASPGEELVQITLVEIARRIALAIPASIAGMRRDCVLSEPVFVACDADEIGSGMQPTPRLAVVSCEGLPFEVCLQLFKRCPSQDLGQAPG